MKGIVQNDLARGFNRIYNFSFRFGYFRLSQLSLTLVLICFYSASFGQRRIERPAPLDPVQARKEAQALVSEMLAQKPESTNTGWLKIRDSSGQQRQIPMRFEMWPTAQGSSSVYEALDAGPPKREQKLTVIRLDGQPNQYLLSENGGAPKTLTGDEAMIPFAGSDFYIADLGLEFLRWPNQRILKKEMRRSRFCDVLESVNPRPGRGSYSKVICWIEQEAPHGIVHADAYDQKGNIFKRFDPTEFEKVQGQYQLQEMEIRNVKADSNTRIEFNVEQKRSGK
jgi:hypothetical protein